MVEKLLRVEQTYVRGYFISCRDPYRKENSLSCSDLVFLPVAMTTLLVGEFLPQQSLLWDRLFLHTIIKQWPFFQIQDDPAGTASSCRCSTFLLDSNWASVHFVPPAGDSLASGTMAELKTNKNMGHWKKAVCIQGHLVHLHKALY